MNTSPELPDPHLLDVREDGCQSKIGRIFGRWETLPVGEFFVLVNGHDPVPLFQMFCASFPGAFTWDYLRRDAEEVRIRISRLAPTALLTTPPLPSCAGGAAVEAGGKAAAAEIDVRGLVPPEPMMIILSAAETLAPGEKLRARTDRRPIHLLPELEARGLNHESAEQPDGSWLTTLQRA